MCKRLHLFRLMTELRKFSLKRFSFPLLALAFCIAITWKTEARRAHSAEIYSTLTSDTIPTGKKDTVPHRVINDSSRANNILRRGIATDSTRLTDTIPPTQTVDSFNIRFSKDTLDAPVVYEAADSGVLLVKEKKFLLYGNTKTLYKNNTLTAPTVEMNQETNVVTAMNSRDSAGNIIVRA